MTTMPFRKHQGNGTAGGKRGKGIFAGSKGRSSSGKRERVNVCPLCAEMGESELDALTEAWISEAPAQNRLAAWIVKCRKSHPKWGLEAFCENDVLRHLEVCLPNERRSRYQRLATHYDHLWQAIDLAHQRYMSEPTVDNAVGYQGLAKQLRAVLIDLENVQNAQELTDEITRLALNPLIRALTNAVISETGSLKEDVASRFGEDEAERLVNDYVGRLAAHFSNATTSAHARVLDVLSAKDQNRKQATNGANRPRKVRGSKTTHSNLRAVS